MRWILAALAFCLPLNSQILAQTGPSVSTNGNIPQGTSPFDVAGRIAVFARSNGDSVALDNLERELPQMTGLSASEKQEVRKLVVEARAEHARARSSVGTPKAAMPSAVIERDSATAKPEPSRVLLSTSQPRSTSARSGLSLLAPAEVTPYALPDSAKGLFSEKYLATRDQYLKKFLWGGETAQRFIVKDNKLVFGDQTLHMGFALVTFAGEARIIAKAGGDPKPSERVIRLVLDAFDRLDNAAEQKLYKTSVPGFFLRDSLRKGEAEDQGIGKAGYIFESDFGSAFKPDGTVDGEKRSDPAMSLDQVVNLFMGFWAVSRWSTDSENVARAKDDATRVMDYLASKKFVIELPDGGSIPAKRGPDARAAAGFLCRMEEAITGRNRTAQARVGLGELATKPLRIRDDHLGEVTIPELKVPIDLPVALTHRIIMALKPVGIVALAMPEIKVRVSDLFPEGARVIKANTPCMHLTVAHTEGHMVPCVHPAVMHTGGDPGPVLPCAHMVPAHPDGHPETLPCAHMGPEHPGGDPKNVPCTHMTVAHKGGDRTVLPCAHMTARDPGGDPVHLLCAPSVQTPR